MIQFKVGDKVRAVKAINRNSKVLGKEGVVIDTYPDSSYGAYNVAIAFIDNVEGHTCENNCQEGHGFYACNSDIELIQEGEKKELTFNLYQRQSNKTAIYLRKTPNSWIYPALGLSAEVGELQNKLKKILRDDVRPSDNELRSELGDILWYLSQLTTELGFTLNDIAKNNFNKLKARQLGNKICGGGDNR